MESKDRLRSYPALSNENRLGRELDVKELEGESPFLKEDLLAVFRQEEEKLFIMMAGILKMFLSYELLAFEDHRFILIMIW